MYFTIETARLHIRPIALSDSAFMFRLTNTPGWLRFIGDRNIKDTTDAEQYIQKIRNNPGFFYHAIELKETGQVIGVVTFLKRDEQEFPDIGFAFLPEFEHKGFAFEASNAYLDRISKEITYSKVIGITDPDNTDSIQLLEKLGFVFERFQTNADETLAIYAKSVQS